MVKKILSHLFLPFKIVHFRSYTEPLAAEIASLIPPKSTVLDVGCDNGFLDSLIIKNKPSIKIVGIDIQANRPSLISRKIYDGHKIPYESNSFDVVMANDVLHHTTDALPLIKEMTRVSRGRVIIKDGIIDGRMPWLINGVIDYLLNAPYGIKCTYNYMNEKEWVDLFTKSHLKLIHKKQIAGFILGFGKEYNSIFLLEKESINH